ncbi:phospholipase A1-like [Eupeodes corollae]|uniref:phospholipase A1-like n=1 Tax=Eupeodes corollae TaxID=290404 RepID=UPI002493B133|nr:phospholipase A1-like [Eupeodes corollae]
MKETIVLILLTASLVIAFPFDQEGIIKEAPTDDGWFVPQLNGSMEWVTRKEAEDFERKLSMGRLFGKKLKVEFYLFTQDNPDVPQEIMTGNALSLAESNFNSQNPTRIIIHGWQNDYTSDVNVEIREAFLDTMECNVISVDWSQKAKNLNYMSSKQHVPEVGKQVAKMIDFLASEADMSLDDLHVIGHSLGAHAAGFTGKRVTSGQIHTIIGLDPAWPLYVLHSCSQRLCETDAFYVESIHTNGGVLGFLQPVGQADFYVGGGVLQPGCGVDVGGVCSHLRAYLYYAESIRENLFSSVKCSHWSLAVSNVCLGEKIPSIRLGSPNNHELAHGYYFTPVNANAPYGIE